MFLDKILATGFAASTVLIFCVTMYSVTQTPAGLHSFAPLSLAVVGVAAWIAAWSLICWCLALIEYSRALYAHIQRHKRCSAYSCLFFHCNGIHCNGSIAVDDLAVVLPLQAGTELEVEEEPEPAPYAKTLTLDRPW